MAENRAHVAAPPEAVFEVLRDPASYLLWVVGSRHIRGVDPNWPQPGSRLHHTVGWGPLTDHDVTEVLDFDPPQHVRLEARAWPFGTAEVDITLRPADRGTELRVVETPTRGPAARFDNRLLEVGLGLRNAWGARRLGRWAEERHRGTVGHEPAPLPSARRRARRRQSATAGSPRKANMS